MSRTKSQSAGERFSGSRRHFSNTSPKSPVATKHKDNQVINQDGRDFWVLMVPHGTAPGMGVSRVAKERLRLWRAARKHMDDPKCCAQRFHVPLENHESSTGRIHWLQMSAVCLQYVYSSLAIVAVAIIIFWSLFCHWGDSWVNFFKSSVAEQWHCHFWSCLGSSLGCSLFSSRASWTKMMWCTWSPDTRAQSRAASWTAKRM